MKLVAGFWLGDTLMDQTQESCTHSSPINISDSGKDRAFCAVLVLYSGMCHHHTHDTHDTRTDPKFIHWLTKKFPSPARPQWSCVLSVLRALERALALASVSWCVKAAEGIDQWKSMAEMVRNGTKTGPLPGLALPCPAPLQTRRVPQQRCRWLTFICCPPYIPIYTAATDLVLMCIVLITVIIVAVYHYWYITRPKLSK